MVLDKKGEISFWVVAMIIAVVALVFYVWWTPKTLAKGASISDEQIDQANKSLIRWSDLTSTEQDELRNSGGDKIEKLMLEDAKYSLQKGISNKDKSELEKAKKIAEDILDLDELSGTTKDEAEDIINDANTILASLKAKDKLKGLELTGGDKGGYSSIMTDPVSAGKVFASEARMKLFILDGKKKEDISTYRSAELQTAGSDVNKVAEIEYTTGLLYENFGDMDNAIKTYDKIYEKFGEQLDIPEFGANALLRKAEILKLQRKGKESYDAYELLWRKYSDKSFNKKEDVQGSFIGLMKAGYGKAIAVRIIMDGFVYDNDEWFTFEGAPEYAEFKGIKPKEEDALANIKNGGQFSANFYVDTGKYINSGEINGDNVDGIDSDKPGSFHVTIKDLLFGEELCSTIYKTDKLQTIFSENEECQQYLILKSANVYNNNYNNDVDRVLLIGEITYFKP